MQYRAEIDGLRALAVIPVIFFHAGFEFFGGGFIGVDVFFVISGYLITSIIISEMSEQGFSLINFYERRARRLIPALFFVMAVCIPFSYALLIPSDLKNFGQSLIAVSTFSSNILFWIESGYFDSAAELKPLLHTWSLAIEEQYYLLFPIFIILTWRLGIRWIIILLFFIFILSLGLANWGAFNKPSASFYLLPTRGWELLIGVFIAFYLKYNSGFKSHSTNQIISMLGILMIIYSIITFDHSTPFPSFYALIPTIGTAFLIFSATPKTIVYKVLSQKFIVGVGLISYSTYLWHQPILAFARHKSFEEMTSLALFGLCILSFFTGWLSWRFVEKPFRHSNKISRSYVFKGTITGIIIFSSIGYLININDGGLKYLPTEEQKVFSRFIDPTKYVITRHATIRLKKFDKTNDKKDILIIGDSSSEDLINALYESDADRAFEFSTYYISVNCGVLFVRNKTDRQESNIPCKEMTFYNKELIELMQLADEVWVSSAWRKDDLKYLKDSIQNIFQYNKNLTIFSGKSFGSISPSWYKQNDRDLWPTALVSNKDIEIFTDLSNLNSSINKIVTKSGASFINIQKLFCDGLDYCTNYIENDLITYDGTHLTDHGAKILGHKLKIIEKTQ